jgi:hypothetical protein
MCVYYQAAVAFTYTGGNSILEPLPSERYRFNFIQCFKGERKERNKDNEMIKEEKKEVKIDTNEIMSLRRFH